MPRFSGLLGGILAPIGLLLAIQVSAEYEQGPTSFPAFAIILTASLSNLALLLRSWEMEYDPIKLTWLLIGSLLTCSLVTLVVWANSAGNLAFQSILLVAVMIFSALMFGRAAIIWRREFTEPFSTNRSRTNQGWFTESQAQLVLVNLLFVWYTIFGALLFSWLETPRWTFDDGVYFTIVSLTTIGLGDFVLLKPISRIIFPLYAVLGLALFGALIYAIRQVILEFLTIQLSVQLYKLLSAWAISQEVDISDDSADSEANHQFYSDIRQNVQRQAVDATNAAVKQQSMSALPAQDSKRPPPLRIPFEVYRNPQPSISQSFTQGQVPDASPLSFSFQLESGPPLIPPATPTESVGVLPFHRAATISIPGDGFKYHRLSVPISSDLAIRSTDDRLRRTWTAAKASATDSGHTHLRTTLARSPSISTALSIMTPLPLAADVPPELFAQPATETGQASCDPPLLFRTLRSILFKHLRYALVATTIYLLIFGYVISKVEGWSFSDGFYFGFCSLTSIGYGDIVPRTRTGRSIFLGFTSVGMGIMTILGSVFAEFLLSSWKIHVEAIMHPVQSI